MNGGEKEMVSIERPLDLLNHLKGKDVCVTLKDRQEVLGELHAFDIHINVVLEIDGNHRFIRGDDIRWIDATSSQIKRKEVKK